MFTKDIDSMSCMEQISLIFALFLKQKSQKGIWFDTSFRYLYQHGNVGNVRNDFGLFSRELINLIENYPNHVDMLSVDCNKESIDAALNEIYEGDPTYFNSFTNLFLQRAKLELEGIQNATGWYIEQTFSELADVGYNLSE